MTKSILWMVRLLWVASILAATAVHAADLVPLKLALIEYEDDPRYKDAIIDARYQAQPWGRLDAAVKLAIKESKFTAKAKGFKFELDTHEVETLDELPEKIKALQNEGVEYFLLDLPAEGINLAVESGDGGSTFFNISALDDSLRNQNCDARLIHMAPSRRMLTDALGQYLVSKKWRKVLVLYGDSAADKDYLNALQVSAKKFGLKLIDQRLYKLGNDPRQRYQNNIALLTAKGEYDVIYVVDSKGEFAVDVPYSVVQPRPVVGSAGLVADWWHWAWERNGAPQVNKRFRKKGKRQMTGYDWSAWLAVKVMAEAALRQDQFNPASLRADLLSESFKIDGAKGYPLNFRPWNNQLRQPIFLTSLNRVIDRAPIEGFLHPTNNLDVLGDDVNASQCALRQGR
ncbi:amino acid ABC transporter substrate-binding protein [Neptuniibacter sp.]|uniref:amino acid ABC transporter substrate-binding protein n=1 Tax=Neptuniibacter sp. TaxID=1962643 RepID=UPI003B5BB57D